MDPPSGVAQPLRRHFVVIDPDIDRGLSRVEHRRATRWRCLPCRRQRRGERLARRSVARVIALRRLPDREPLSVVGLPDLRRPVRGRAGACRVERASRVLFPHRPQEMDLPLITDAAWDPIWSACSEARIPVAFHGRFGDDLNRRRLYNPEWRSLGYAAAASIGSITAFLDNMDVLMTIMFSSILPRLPDLRIASAWLRVRSIPLGGGRLALPRHRHEEGAARVRDAPERVLQAPGLHDTLVRAVRSRKAPRRRRTGPPDVRDGPPPPHEPVSTHVVGQGVLRAKRSQAWVKHFAIGRATPGLHCTVAQHVGRPGTPTDQAWIESFNGTLDGRVPVPGVDRRHRGAAPRDFPQGCYPAAPQGLSVARWSSTLGVPADHSSKRVPTVFGMNASPNRAPIAC